MQTRFVGTRRMTLLAFALAIALTSSLTAASEDARDEQALWRALANGGLVVVMRHAIAPGVGDPEQFRLDDCSTQRNLSAEGRVQARAIGAAFRNHGIIVDRVMSSEWCRCLETAHLLGLGKVEPFPPLNSFFAARQREAAQMAELVPWVASRESHGIVILVTHQVVVTALTGLFPSSGEIVLVRPQGDGSIEVIGAILPPK